MYLISDGYFMKLSSPMFVQIVYFLYVKKEKKISRTGTFSFHFSLVLLIAMLDRTQIFPYRLLGIFAINLYNPTRINSWDVTARNDLLNKTFEKW